MPDANWVTRADHEQATWRGYHLVIRQISEQRFAGFVNNVRVVRVMQTRGHTAERLISSVNERLIKVTPDVQRHLITSRNCCWTLESEPGRMLAIARCVDPSLWHLRLHFMEGICALESWEECDAEVREHWLHYIHHAMKKVVNG